MGEIDRDVEVCLSRHPFDSAADPTGNGHGRFPVLKQGIFQPVQLKKPCELHVRQQLGRIIVLVQRCLYGGRSCTVRASRQCDCSIGGTVGLLATALDRIVERDGLSLVGMGEGHGEYSGCSVLVILGGGHRHLCVVAHARGEDCAVVRRVHLDALALNLCRQTFQTLLLFLCPLCAVKIGGAQIGDIVLNFQHGLKVTQGDNGAIHQKLLREVTVRLIQKRLYLIQSDLLAVHINLPLVGNAPILIQQAVLL